jgi:alkylated DNA nucleotide flippase Atl1
MAKKRKSWREKLERKQEPKLVDDPKGRGKMLVPTPMLVNRLVHKIPQGKLVTVAQIREKLAEDFKADLTCPLTTGIFLRIVAEAAEEDLKEGRKNVAPYWRVVKPDGSLNEKFPGGVEAQAKRLEKEGYTIIPAKGKKPPKVKDFEKYLLKL